MDAVIRQMAAAKVREQMTTRHQKKGGNERSVAAPPSARANTKLTSSPQSRRGAEDQKEAQAFADKADTQPEATPPFAKEQLTREATSRLAASH